MRLTRPTLPDVLRPTEAMALDAWAARVRAHQEQIERCREVEDPADFYAPFAERFARHPARRDEPTLEVLRAMVRADDVWLDIGAGGGRYSLPIAIGAQKVIAVDPSPSMLEVLSVGMQSHGIANVEAHQARWPPTRVEPFAADVALMAHVGYGIEAIGPFLEAAEEAAARACVVVFSAADTSSPAAALWRPIHGEDRVALPRLPELLTLLVARGRLPSVTLVARRPAVFGSVDELMTMARRQLWLRPGSTRDERLRSLLASAATRREPGWALDWRVSRVGVVSWDTAGDT